MARLEWVPENAPVSNVGGVIALQITSARFVQLENAPPPMEVTPAGSDVSARFVQP